VTFSLAQAGESLRRHCYEENDIPDSLGAGCLIALGRVCCACAHRGDGGTRAFARRHRGAGGDGGNLALSSADPSESSNSLPRSPLVGIPHFVALSDADRADVYRGDRRNHGGLAEQRHG
jgi:hypothetical protein